ncbi:MAG TPA: hypothetical protein VFS21_37200, partial [Roseiflexaceae bacterium]|nr:hypothetical protein [Roseiflexaceae bacterium]
TAVYWHVTLPTREAALALLDQVAQLHIRPQAGGDLSLPEQTTLFFEDDMNSAPLLLLLRRAGGQQVPADNIARGAV